MWMLKCFVYFTDHFRFLSIVDILGSIFSQLTSSDENIVSSDFSLLLDLSSLQI